MNLFDGREFVKQKEIELAKKVASLKENGIAPKLVSIVVGDEKGAIFYQNLKRKAAERVGAELSVVPYQFFVSIETILQKVNDLNTDPEVHGIMLQLPLPNNFSKDDRDKIIDAIDDSKDVDGMKVESKFKSPVVLSVLAVLEKSPFKEKPCKVVVVGAHGFEGSKIVGELTSFGHEVSKVDTHTNDLISITIDKDIIISATGSADLIKENMVKDGAVLIDIGFPEGDISKAAYEKASFVSPVPGGIGPLTIYFLIENLVNTVIY